MILDNFSRAAQYKGLHPGLAAGFEWLSRLPADLPEGRHDIDGDRLYALVQEYETGPAADKRFESHRRNIDIQYVVSGRETIFCADSGGLRPVTEYDPENDLIFYSDPAASSALQLEAGSFALFFPQDAHKPGCAAGSAARVKKVVVKVRI